MKAKEFTIVEKKRKNRKLRWAAYGPGPYGMYGVDTGYSGDGGVGEATYPGNVGMMELIKFFTRYPEYKPTYLDIKRKNGAIAALKYALEKMETELSGEPFVKENFADGKVKGKSRPGRVKKSGASCKGSVTDLRARAKKYGGERGKMYHWCANMKGGKKK